MYLIESKCIKTLLVTVLLLFVCIGVSTTKSYATTTGAATIVKTTVDSKNYNIGEEFIVTVEIENPDDYYAGDIYVEYNDEMFDLKGVGVSNSSQLRIYSRTDTVTTTGAGTRIIIASNGPQNVIKDDQDIIRLRFIAKKEGSNGFINVSKAIVADGYGNEYLPLSLGTVVNIGGVVMPDTNNDGRVSIGDLAIASRLMGEADWENYYPDVDHDGTVNEKDLTSIVKEIIRS